MLLKYINELGQRIAQAQQHNMNVIMTLDEADRLYTMLGDAVAVVHGHPIVYFDAFGEK